LLIFVFLILHELKTRANFFGIKTKINKELLKKKFYEFTSGKQEKFWKTNFVELYKSDLDFWRALQDPTK